LDYEQDIRLANGKKGYGAGRDQRPPGHTERSFHGFGVAMVTSENPLPLHILADLMGHSSTATTEIYTRVLAGEKQKMVLNAWKG